MANGRLKLALYEWSLIGAASAAAGAIVLWIVSSWTGLADLGLMYADGLGVSLADGEFTIGTGLDSWPVFERQEQHGFRFNGNNYRMRIPGIRFRYIASSPFGVVWKLKVSLFVPVAVAVLGAVAAGLKYRQVKTANSK